MADIVLPIAKKLAKQVPKLLVKEIKFLCEVSKEVKSVEEKLENIGSVLKKADVMPDNEEEFDKWVSKLRDLAFKAEDVIEVFINNETLYHGCDVFQLIIGCFCQIITLHKLKNEIDDINTELTKLAKEKPEIKERSRENGDETSNPLREKGGASSKIKEDDIVGFQKEAGQLMSWLTEKEPQGQLVVVSIWAQGGAGKSTLAQKIYRSSFAKSQFDCVAWVSVSQEYDVKNSLQAILEQDKKLTKEEKDELQTVEIVQEKVDACLKEKDYLIILDDVWKKMDLDDLIKAFPISHGKKCRVLLTTRNREVAGPATHMLKLPDLNDEESMELFLKKVYPFSPAEISSVPEEKKRWARKILSKCKGLPISIVLLGGILSFERDSTIEWKNLSDRVHSALVNSELANEGLQKVFALSYNELPYHFKSCFLYFGLLPEDSVIDCDKLIRLWLAEGILEQQGDNEAMEEVAEKCLKALIRRSMIQVSEFKSNGDPQTCRIHDLIRDLAIQEAKKTKFSSNSKEQLLVLVEGIRRIALHPKDTEIHGTSTMPHQFKALSWSHPQSSSQSFRMRPRVAEGAADLVGFQEEVDKLASALTNEVPLGLGRHGVVSIVGAEGTGKTTIARKVYNNVKSHFAFRAWVHVTFDFDVLSVLWSILEQVTTLKDTEIKLMDREVSQKMLHNLLEGKSFLIVMDEIMNERDWDRIKCVFPKPVKDQKCRVLVTTFHPTIARYIDPSTVCVELECLNENLSLKLFLKTIFKCSQDEMPEASLSKEMVDIARKMVVEYCQGLPSAILALGGLLSGKAIDVTVWSNMLESLNQEGFEGTAMEKVFLLCFLDLPDYLRSCIRCFKGTFCTPVESNILIQEWNKLGLLDLGDNKAAIEDVGRDCLQELIQRNLLNVMKWRSNGDPQTCIMQTPFYIFLQTHESHRLSKYNHRRLAEGSLPTAHNHPIDSQVQYGKPTTPCPHAQPKTFSLSQLLSCFGDFFKFPNHVHSMLCFSKNPQFDFERFPLLRVVDLQGAEKMEEIPNEIRNLNLLKYLSLRGTRVKRIPPWIAYLCNLQTLDAPTSQIPIEALDLRQLRYLFADSFYSPSSSSSSSSSTGLCINIGVLKHLHTLELDIADWIIIGLEELTSLRVLRLRLHGSHDDNVLKAIAILTGLKFLSLTHAKTSSLSPSPVHLPSFSNHKDVNELILEGTKIELPILEHFPPSLTYLWLEMYVDNEVLMDPFSTLQQLPFLKKLCLRLFQSDHLPEGQMCFCAMTCSTKGFPELEYLYINVDFYLLAIFIPEIGAMRSLRVLHIEGKDMLGGLPIGLRHVTTLKELIITRGYNVRNNLLHHTGEEWEEVKGIQSLSIKYLDESYVKP